MTFIVFNTVIKKRTTAFDIKEYNLFRGVSEVSRQMSFLFNYDIESKKRLDIALICHLCKEQKHTVPFAPTPTARAFPSIRREWPQANVMQHIREMRRNISENGRCLQWFLPFHLKTYFYYDRSKRDKINEGSEFEKKDFGTGPKPSILRQNTFHVAVLAALFPLEPGKSRSFKLDPGYYHGDPLEIGFSKPKMDEDDIIFITSEEVKFKKNASPLDLYLSVLDNRVWIFLGSSLGIASLLYSTLMPVTEVRNDRGRGTLIIRNIRTVSCDFIAALGYLSTAFLGQFPRDLPSSNRHDSGYVSNARLCLAPWALGIILLTNWYSAFLETSFKFRFPYELRQEHWRDFENYSIYLLINAKHTITEGDVGHHRTLFGFYRSERERLRVLSDMNNTNFDAWMWSHNDPLPYQPLRSDFIARPLRPTCIETRSESLVCPHNTLHPFILWFKNEWARTAQCSHNTNSSHVKQINGTTCELDRKAILKMTYRLDSVNYEELHWYVGEWYQNITKVGRQIGFQLFEKMGRKQYRWDRNVYLSRKGNKKGYIQIDGINGTTNAIYWMTRRPQAAFVVTKTEFPWYWNLFKNLMIQNETLRFAYMGPKSLKTLRPDRGLGGNGFESPVQIFGPPNKYLPESEWLLQRVRALTHSGIVGFLAKWDLLLHPPVDRQMTFVEESDAGVEALTVEHDSVKAAFTVFFRVISVAVVMLVTELALNVTIDIL